MPTDVAAASAAKPSGLDHVAIAVKDLEAAVAFYERVLGIPCTGRERVADQKVDVAFFGQGAGRIELICPFDPESGVAKFLARRGDGLHHICLEVPDLRAALAQMQRDGRRVIDAEPRVGAGGAEIAFVHPAATHGVLLELKQKGTGAH